MSIDPVENTVEIRAHAILSASSAKRWMSCTPSARLEEQFPDTKSTYANEGSLAHEISELKLRKQYIEPIRPKKFNAAMKKLKEHELYQEEMQGYTDQYVDYVASQVHSYASAPYINIEKRIDYSTYAPDGFGTGDCILIGGNQLQVIDLKYGKGVPVSAEENHQTKLYALGAYTEYSFLYPIDTVKMTIVQPRLDSISEYTMTIDELLKWGNEVVKPKAQLAFKGEGEFIAGDHCQFCRAKALCRARSEFNSSLGDYKMMKPPLISNEEVGQILLKAQDLAKWAKDLEEYALNECLIGNEIPGWKAVEGRSDRKISDVDKAFEVLTTNGYDEALLYVRKPLGIAALESLVTKKKFNELLSDYIIKPPGKPALAVETDKREALTNKISAADAFKEAIN